MNRIFSSQQIIQEPPPVPPPPPPEPIIRTPDIIVNVKRLKKSKNDYLMTHLRERIQQCKERQIAYWNHFKKMRLRHNIISFPLLIISSATGVSSAAQFNSIGNKSIVALTTILGILSAILNSVQRYCAYSERSENSKLMAKSWGRLSRKIENTLVYVNSNSCRIDDVIFTKLVEEIQKDIEAVAQQAEDLPSSSKETKTSNYNIVAPMMRTARENNNAPMMAAVTENDNAPPPPMMRRNAVESRSSSEISDNSSDNEEEDDDDMEEIP